MSRRIKQFGTNVIIGDLVYDEQNCQDNVIDESTDVINETADYSASNSDDKNETDATEQKNIDTATSTMSEENSDQDFPVVKILTEKDLPNYTLTDVVMPLPGWKVTYPPYAKTWYDEYLAKDGLTTDLKQKNK